MHFGADYIMEQSTTSSLISLTNLTMSASKGKKESNHKILKYQSVSRVWLFTMYIYHNFYTTDCVGRLFWCLAYGTVYVFIKQYCHGLYYTLCPYNRIRAINVVIYICMFSFTNLLLEKYVYVLQQ